LTNLSSRPKSKHDLRDAVRGRNDAKEKTLELMVAERYVNIEEGGQARLHHPVRPLKGAPSEGIVPG
jgi:hypothetical protein